MVGRSAAEGQVKVSGPRLAAGQRCDAEAGGGAAHSILESRYEIKHEFWLGFGPAVERAVSGSDTPRRGRQRHAR